MKFRLFMLAMLISSPLFAGDIADEISRSDKNLSQIKDMITVEKNEISTLKNEKLKAAKELKKAELELQYHKKLANKLNKRLTQAGKDIAFLNFQKTKQTSRQKELEDNIRAANFYLAGAGETELLEALILGDELTEVTAGLQIIARVDSKLFQMVHELEENKKDMEITLEKLHAKQAELEEAADEKQETIKQYQSNKLLVKQLYKMAEEDEKIQKEYVAMLQEKQDDLENKIKELEAAQVKQGQERKFEGLKQGFAAAEGKLEWPLKGKIIEHFGTKKVKGFRGVVQKKGIKIETNERHVSSVYDGVVIHTDSAWGLGWFAIVEHSGGYYTLYANMDEITVKNNQKVHSGEILGTIDIDHEGNTPYLYFEIRIHDKAVDPEKWLTS
ncbi:MAG: murein hydrolase activator EnvC [Deferribacterales bacterium]